MRKTSYVLAFVAACAVFIMNVFSARQVGWIVVKTPEVLGTSTVVRYGLMRQCTRTVTKPIEDDGDGELSYYNCRKFPLRNQDSCEEDNSFFCTAWTSAGYAYELAIGFGALCLITILFGVSTGSRRRRIWKAVAGLAFLFSIFQIIAFALVTDVLHNKRYPTFEYGHFGHAYALNIICWVLGLMIGGGVIATGVYAEKGHHWAAGNRAYRRIPDHD